MAAPMFASTFGASEYYSPVLLTPQMILGEAQGRDVIEDALRLTQTLSPDNYTKLLEDFYRTGLNALGDRFAYADIMTTLLAAARRTQPARYLEVGVRRGRSLAAVAQAHPDVTMWGFDMWMENYGNNPNPGPAFVQNELRRVGYTQDTTFVSGNSHETLPAFFAEHPDLTFDMMTVDGDHTREGALQDLRDVLPRLEVGGVLVFDDIAHPRLPHLLEVWNEALAEDGGVRSATFNDLGYGVAVGVRFWPPGQAPQPHKR